MLELPIAWLNFIIKIHSLVCVFLQVSNHWPII